MSAPQKFGPLLRGLRKQQGITLGKMAKHLSVSVPYVSDVEAQRRGPFSENNLQKLAALFGDKGVLLADTARTERGYVQLNLESLGKHKTSAALRLAQIWPDLTEQDAARLQAVILEIA